MYSTIVGTRWRPANAQLALLSVVAGHVVELRRDPYNPHDENAIECHIELDNESYHVGFLPRTDAQVLAPLMDEGQEYGARILTVGKRPLLEVRGL